MSRILTSISVLRCVCALACVYAFACGPSNPAGGPDADPAGDADPVQCSQGEYTCGAECCVAGEICDINAFCCPLPDLCGSECCAAGEVCEGSVCQLDCGADARCTDASGDSVCCAAGELCTSEGCFAAVTSCQDFVDCPAGQYCEPELGYCLPQPTGEVCQQAPTGGKPVPSLQWHWDGTEPGLPLPASVQVMMTAFSR